VLVEEATKRVVHLLDGSVRAARHRQQAVSTSLFFSFAFGPVVLLTGARIQLEMVAAP